MCWIRMNVTWRDVITYICCYTISSACNPIRFILGTTLWEPHSGNHCYNVQSRSSNDECILYDYHNILPTQKINYIPIQFMQIWASYTGELLSLIHNTICHCVFEYKAYNVALCTRIFIIHINGIIFSKYFQPLSRLEICVRASTEYMMWFIHI